MKRLHKIIYLTGTRAEYGLMKETLKELNKKFDLKIIATGTHLLKKFGYTINNIRRDNFSIISEINLPYNENDPRSMADNIGKLIPHVTKVLSQVKPDLVLVEGDRGEQLSIAIAAATMNIPIAHTSGGVISKSIDDSYRNAITKLAHIHLVPTKKAAKRIAFMNEESWRIHVVGTPINLQFSDIDIYQKLDLKKDEPLLLVLQHPISTQFKQSAKQMMETLEAIKHLEYQTIIIYPNSDAGSKQMIDIIEKYRKLSFVKIFKNLDNDVFMNLLKKTDVLIGNSSAGIVEAPFFKIPVVNIGIRQNGREAGNNVINANHNKNEIRKAIRKALTKKFRQSICKNPYEGHGKTEINIANVLSKIKINSRLLSKEPVY